MINKKITQINALQLYGKPKQEPAFIIEIPRQLMKEVSLFRKRNSLKKFSKVLESNVNEEVCPHCLKAFMLVRAKEMGLSDEVMDFLYTAGEGKLGHHEYYEDNSEIIKLPESLTEIYD